MNLLSRWLSYPLFLTNLRTPQAGPVFIIGTGRSGTHYLCKCLGKFANLDDVFGGRESPFLFRRIARRTVAGERLGPLELGYYRWMAARVHPRTLLDQTHPNIWNVEDLRRHFPSARFVGIRRNVHSVVTSMNAHEGVSRWALNSRSYQAPNRFLGITVANELVYRQELTPLQRHVFRWCAHVERLAQLEADYPDAVLVIDYEDLHERMQEVMARIARFLRQPPPDEYVQFDTAALSKKDQLSPMQRRQIDEALSLWKSLR